MSEAPIRHTPCPSEWTIHQSGRTGRWAIYSSDFTHDAGLELSGDFADADQAKAYAQSIADKLNALASESTSRIDGWNAAIDAAARIADREWVESNALSASKVSRKIADGIRDLRTTKEASDVAR